MEKLLQNDKFMGKDIAARIVESITTNNTLVLKNIFAGNPEQKAFYTLLGRRLG